jgi:hypothetical protein
VAQCVVLRTYLTYIHSLEYESGAGENKINVSPKESAGTCSKKSQKRAAEVKFSDFVLYLFLLNRLNKYFFGLIFILPRNELKQFLVLSKKCRPSKIFYECNSYIFSLSFKSDLAA